MNLLRPCVRTASRIDALTRNRQDLLDLTEFHYKWAKSVREAIGLPGRAMAARMEISQAALSKLETGEAEGNITIGKLRVVANALDCDFVYAFVPRAPIEPVAQELQMAQAEARKAHRKIPRNT